MKHFAQYDYDIKAIAGDIFRKTRVTQLGVSIGEACMDWDVGAHYFERRNSYETYDYLHGHYGTYEEGSAILDKMLSQPMTQAELEANKDEIETDILRAMAEAYRNNYENGIYDYIKDACEAWVNEHNASGFYFIDSNGQPCGFYECESMRVYYTKKQYEAVILADAIAEGYAETKAEVLAASEREYWIEQYVEGNCDLKPCNWGYFDERGCRFDEEGWQDMLKDYAESVYSIEKQRKEKAAKLKAMITSHAPLEARQAFLESA